jgi:hypothetical protein
MGHTVLLQQTHMILNAVKLSNLLSSNFVSVHTANNFGFNTPSDFQVAATDCPLRAFVTAT